MRGVVRKIVYSTVLAVFWLIPFTARAQQADTGREPICFGQEEAVEAALRYTPSLEKAAYASFGIEVRQQDRVFIATIYDMDDTASQPLRELEAGDCLQLRNAVGRLLAWFISREQPEIFVDLASSENASAPEGASAPTKDDSIAGAQRLTSPKSAPKKEVVGNRADLRSDARPIKRVEKRPKGAVLTKVIDHWGVQLGGGVNFLRFPNVAGVVSIAGSYEWENVWQVALGGVFTFPTRVELNAPGDVWVDIWALEVSLTGCRLTHFAQAKWRVDVCAYTKLSLLSAAPQGAAAGVDALAGSWGIGPRLALSRYFGAFSIGAEVIPYFEPLEADFVFEDAGRVYQMPIFNLQLGLNVAYRF